MTEAAHQAMEALKHRVETVETKVNKVESAQLSHEEICSLRYNNILKDLDSNRTTLKTIMDNVEGVDRKIFNGLSWALSGSLIMIGGLVVYIFLEAHK